ncbi:MAG: nucleoside monophosphate kinase [Endomicrobium sp.]|jgi:adenylate kinase|nr:nucleoside monophosphate kinase [Endomicrobium sp.]
MNYILIGPPGSGKSTQALKITRRLNIIHLSTGNMFREMKESNKIVNKYLATGQLVPDEIVNDMISKFFEKTDVKRGFLLDGFPRTINQAKMLNKILKNQKIKINIVFFLSIGFDEIIKRILKRKTCLCGINYDNITLLSIKNLKRCNICGGEFLQRDDDKIEKVIRTRLSIYETQTQPLIKFYENLGLLVKIKGCNDELCVFKEINSYFNKK